MTRTAQKPQLRLQGIDSHKARIDFLRRLKLIQRFEEIFLESYPEDLAAKRDELIAGRSLLQDAETIALCDELIAAFRSRLAIIPHETYLRSALRNGHIS